MDVDPSSFGALNGDDDADRILIDAKMLYLAVLIRIFLSKFRSSLFFH